MSDIPFKRVWRIYSDWDIKLEDWVFTSEEAALKHLRRDPEVQHLLEVEGDTLEDWIKMKYLQIVPLGVLE